MKDQLHNQHPLQNENAGPLVPTQLRISRGQQQSIKPSSGPSKCRALGNGQDTGLWSQPWVLKVLSYLSFACECPQRVDPQFKRVQISGLNKQPRLLEFAFQGDIEENALEGFPQACLSLPDASLWL